MQINISAESWVIYLFSYDYNLILIFNFFTTFCSDHIFKLSTVWIYDRKLACNEHISTQASCLFLVISFRVHGLGWLSIITENSIYTCHLLRSRLSHSAVSSLYSARLLRNLANSCCNSVWRSRDTLALTTVAANARTNTSHANDSPAAPIIQVIVSATPR